MGSEYTKQDLDAYIRKAEQWRKQLGAAQSRENRLKARIRELELENAALLESASRYMTLYEESTEEARRAFNAMTGDAAGQLEDLLDGRSK